MREGPVVLVGGSNADIGGKPDRMLIEGDSNPGRVRFSLGGVGHNIARNLGRLGMETVFLTALGRDGTGDRIAAECAACGVDCSRVLRLEDCATPTYLFIADHEGDMRLAVSDMAACDRMTPAYLAENLDALNGAAAVVADANLPEESLLFLAERCAAPLFADPVSVSKSGRLKRALPRLYALKPNRLEAELLSGVPVRSREDLPGAAEKLLETGLRQVCVSLGAHGVFAAERGYRELIPCFPAEVRNTTGAGDAFMAGLVWGFLKGKPLREAARIASAAAAVAAESGETVSPEMSPAAVERKMRECGPTAGSIGSGNAQDAMKQNEIKI